MENSEPITDPSATGSAEPLIKVTTPVATEPVIWGRSVGVASSPASAEPRISGRKFADDGGNAALSAASVEPRISGRSVGAGSTPVSTPPSITSAASARRRLSTNDPAHMLAQAHAFRKARCSNLSDSAAHFLMAARSARTAIQGHEIMRKEMSLPHRLMLMSAPDSVYTSYSKTGRSPTEEDGHVLSAWIRCICEETTAIEVPDDADAPVCYCEWGLQVVIFYVELHQK